MVWWMQKGLGALMTVSTASVMWLSVRNTWDVMGLGLWSLYQLLRLCGFQWETRGMWWVWGSGHCINCFGYVAFSEKHVGCDGFGALVTISTVWVKCVLVTFLRVMTMKAARGWGGGSCHHYKAEWPNKTYDRRTQKEVSFIIAWCYVSWNCLQQYVSRSCS